MYELRLTPLGMGQIPSNRMSRMLALNRKIPGVTVVAFMLGTSIEKYRLFWNESIF
jgi:hypothetical protein